MKNKTAFWLVLLIAFLTTFLYSADSSMDFIRVLEENGMIDEAITEYKRYLFFNQLSDEEKGIVWLRMGVCYRALNDEAEMMKAFNHSFVLLKNSQSIQDLNLELGIFYLARGKTGWARSFLEKINRSDLIQNAKKYLLVSYLMDEDWDAFFSRIKVKEIPKPIASDIKKLVREIIKMKRKYKTLLLLDYILPGIGHVFLGNFLEGGESLLFHGFFVYQILMESSITGKIIFGWGLYRLYLKSTENGRKYLHEKINNKRMLLEEKIFEKIMGMNGN